MNEIAEHLAAVQLGIECEAFMESVVGKYLIERINEEKEEAIRDFPNVPPTNPLMVMSVQNKLWRADQFLKWISEAIEEGQHSERELQENYQ